MEELNKEEIDALRRVAKIAPQLEKLARIEEKVELVVQKDDRWKWLATGSRNVLAWVAGILGTAYVIWEGLGKLVKTLAGTG